MRFAIVGCGEIAVTHVRALSRLGPNVEVVACSDVEPFRAHDFASRFQLEALPFQQLIAQSDIDAITVCTPSGRHAEVGVPALRAGKHVLVEKPMEVTVHACRRLIAASEESGARLAVVSQRRFDPAVATVREALVSGEFGALIYAECRVPWYRTQEYYDSADWRGTWELDGGGSLMNQGLHALDLMRWLCGSVVEVRAAARTATHVRTEVEDLICALLVFENGALGTVMASTSSYPAFPARINVQGARGGAVIEGDSLAAFAVVGGRNLPAQTPARHTWDVAAGGTRAATPPIDARSDREVEADETDLWTAGHMRQMVHFIDAIKRNTQPTVTGADALETVRLIESIYRAARTRRTVRL